MKHRGFTLIEMLIVIAIVMVIGVALLLSAPGEKASLQVTSVTQEIATTLREAQSRTMSGDENGQTVSGFWGVEMANTTATTPYFGLFFATSTAGITSSIALVGGHYALPSSVAYTTSTLPVGGSLFVYYSAGGVAPGQPIGAYGICGGFTCPATTTISVGLYESRTTPLVSTTISIAPTGEVGY